VDEEKERQKEIREKLAH